MANDRPKVTKGAPKFKNTGGYDSYFLTLKTPELNNIDAAITRFTKAGWQGVTSGTIRKEGKYIYPK